METTFLIRRELRVLRNVSNARAHCRHGVRKSRGHFRELNCEKKKGGKKERKPSCNFNNDARDRQLQSGSIYLAWRDDTLSAIGSRIFLSSHLDEITWLISDSGKSKITQHRAYHVSSSFFSARERAAENFTPRNSPFSAGSFFSPPNETGMAGRKK